MVSDSVTRKERLLVLFKDGEWHKTAEIFKVGGFGGLRRLQELRHVFRTGKYPGFIDIEKRRREKSKQFEYRFIKGNTVGLADLQSKSDKTPTIVKHSKSVQRRLAIQKSTTTIDRESKIVQRKQELEGITRNRSRMMPVRALPSSSVTVEGESLEKVG